jgi:hypothetical protein
MEYILDSPYDCSPVTMLYINFRKKGKNALEYRVRIRIKSWMKLDEMNDKKMEIMRLQQLKIQLFSNDSQIGI